MLLFGILLCFSLVLNASATQPQQVKPALKSDLREAQALPMRARNLPLKPVHSTIAPGYDRQRIRVKFTDELRLSLDASGCPMDRTGARLTSANAVFVLAQIQTSGGIWKKAMTVPEDRLYEMKATAEANLNWEMANLNNYYILKVPEDVQTEDWLDHLNALDEVELAEPIQLPAPLPTPPDFEDNQGYLEAATSGIDANHAWTLPGGTGSLVTIVDIEYSWNLDHDDLPDGIDTLVPDGYVASDPFNNTDHGTAVLGELVSLNNGWGTTGAAYGADIYVAPSYLDNGTGPAVMLDVAITNAAAELFPGDIILLEAQVFGPNYAGVDQEGLVPVEWVLSNYNAIVTAIGNGIHVVEAGCNGSEDLDAAAYSQDNNNHWPFLNQNSSGAIIVGAGASPGGSSTDRSRLGFSNYGRSVYVQAWGENVYTTGYGTAHNTEGQNLLYANGFSGTSSASPIVTSAVALIESITQEQLGTPTLPSVMLGKLVSGGSPQQAGGNPRTQHIGPRPDIEASLDFEVAPIGGTPPEYRNDDGSTMLPLEFPFAFFGEQYNEIYVNNNGNVSFGGGYYSYSPSGFPVEGFAMIAPFWADVDTWNTKSGIVYYRSEADKFTVVWERVGYYSSQADKLNSFKLEISDGLDWDMGLGNNVCFSYEDMQWTTGSASNGVNGFGGYPATAGANKGDGENYALIGRFDHEGSDFDGSGGNSDGVSYLDYKKFCFDISIGAGTIEGSKWRDENNNGTWDEGESGMSGWTIRIDPGPKFATTDFLGDYFFSFLEPGTYTVSEVLKPNWEQTWPTAPGTHTIVIDEENQTFSGIDFGNHPMDDIQDLAVSVAGGRARPGFEKQFGITYENKGTVDILDAQIHFYLPAQLTYISSSEGGAYDGGLHAVVWDYDVITAGAVGWLWAKGQIPADIALGTQLTSSATINPVAGDVNPADNEDSETQTVTGSLDPNDKLVSPEGFGESGLIARDQLLTYTVRFQNVGTDTAFTVVVRDMLSDNLDLGSLTIGASSHPYTFGIVEPRELVWTFNNILLPDSTTNEPASNGFLKYTVMPLPGLPGGTAIDNFADIYFDYNAPVRTNVVHNQIDAPPVTTTSVFQNQAATRFADIIVTSNMLLPLGPVVTGTVGNTTTDVEMESVSGSEYVYSGAFEFTESGTYTISTSAASESGQDTTRLRTFNATLARSAERTSINSVNGQAILNIHEDAIAMDTWFMADMETAGEEVLYKFGPPMTFDRTVAVDIYFDPFEYPDASQLFIYQGTDDAEIQLESQVYPEQNKVRAFVTSLGTFRLGLDPDYSGSNLVPVDYALQQNYPNPFNPSTVIEYNLPVDGQLSLTVYNLSGQLIQVLYDSYEFAGQHSVRWDGRNEKGQSVASGVYFYHLQTADFNETRKMLLIR